MNFANLCRKDSKEFYTAIILLIEPSPKVKKLLLPYFRFVLPDVIIQFMIHERVILVSENQNNGSKHGSRPTMRGEAREHVD